MRTVLKFDNGKKSVRKRKVNLTLHHYIQVLKANKQDSSSQSSEPSVYITEKV